MGAHLHDGSEMMDLKLKQQMVDVAAINRRGNELLDPHWHAYAPGGDPTRCSRCHCARADHKTWLWRLIARALRWRR